MIVHDVILWQKHIARFVNSEQAAIFVEAMKKHYPHTLEIHVQQCDVRYAFLLPGELVIVSKRPLWGRFLQLLRGKS